jgi:hypothetical protein
LKPGREGVPTQASPRTLHHFPRLQARRARLWPQPSSAHSWGLDVCVLVVGTPTEARAVEMTQPAHVPFPSRSTTPTTVHPSCMAERGISMAVQHEHTAHELHGGVCMHAKPNRSLTTCKPQTLGNKSATQVLHETYLSPASAHCMHGWQPAMHPCMLLHGCKGKTCTRVQLPMML